jgi:proteasome lid subunit RPN8/RPN11
MLFIRPEDLAGLRAHAEEEYPRECCGILLGCASGNERRVARVLRGKNTRSERERYSIDPAELIAAQKTARAEGWEIVGFYHSHPDHAPQPSVTDLEEAHWVDCCYVIVAVAQGRGGDLRAFLLRGGEDAQRFEAEPLQVAATDLRRR